MLPLGRNPATLEQLRECNGLLDEVQKGLAAYLEKKRMFFPRCVLSSVLNLFASSWLHAVQTSQRRRSMPDAVPCRLPATRPLTLHSPHVQAPQHV